jgi:hypothetical protein
MVFRIYDVGGQRSEKRKWLCLFDCVHAVSHLDYSADQNYQDHSI